jgi:hypothetical protein
MRGTVPLRVSATQEGADRYAAEWNSLFPRGTRATVAEIPVHDAPEPEPATTDDMVEAFRDACDVYDPLDEPSVRAGLAAALATMEGAPEITARRIDAAKAMRAFTGRDADGVRQWAGSVSEVADEIARYVMKLERSGAARGVVASLLDWIQTYEQEDTLKQAHECTGNAWCLAHPSENGPHGA